ncbi:hypothetical protein Goklo_002479, partial [Gossypium klotzschianum]|nr:hypothetical protein [Gossypium klotzschianum]
MKNNLHLVANSEKLRSAFGQMENHTQTPFFALYSLPSAGSLPSSLPSVGSLFCPLPDLGFSTHDVADIVASDPWILTRS